MPPVRESDSGLDGGAQGFGSLCGLAVGNGMEARAPEGGSLEAGGGKREGVARLDGVDVLEESVGGRWLAEDFACYGGKIEATGEQAGGVESAGKRGKEDEGSGPEVVDERTNSDAIAHEEQFTSAMVPVGEGEVSDEGGERGQAGAIEESGDALGLAGEGGLRERFGFVQTKVGGKDAA